MLSCVEDDIGEDVGKDVGDGVNDLVLVTHTTIHIEDDDDDVNGEDKYDDDVNALGGSVLMVRHRTIPNCPMLPWATDYHWMAHPGRSHYKTNSLSDLGHFEDVCLRLG